MYVRAIIGGRVKVMDVAPLTPTYDFTLTDIKINGKETRISCCFIDGVDTLTLFTLGFTLDLGDRLVIKGSRYKVIQRDIADYRYVLKFERDIGNFCLYDIINSDGERMGQRSLAFRDTDGTLIDLSIDKGKKMNPNLNTYTPTVEYDFHDVVVVGGVLDGVLEIDLAIELGEGSYLLLRDGSVELIKNTVFQEKEDAVCYIEISKDGYKTVFPHGVYYCDGGTFIVDSEEVPHPLRTENNGGELRFYAERDQNPIFDNVKLLDGRPCVETEDDCLIDILNYNVIWRN